MNTRQDIIEDARNSISVARFYMKVSMDMKKRGAYGIYNRLIQWCRGHPQVKGVFATFDQSCVERVDSRSRQTEHLLVDAPFTTSNSLLSPKELELAKNNNPLNIMINVRTKNIPRTKLLRDLMEDRVNKDLLTNLEAVTLPTVTDNNLDDLNKVLDILAHQCPNLTSLTCREFLMPVKIPYLKNLTSFSYHGINHQGQLTFSNPKKLLSFFCMDTTKFTMPNFECITSLFLGIVRAPLVIANLDSLTSFSCDFVCKSLVLRNLENLTSVSFFRDIRAPLVLFNLKKLTSVSCGSICNDIERKYVGNKIFEETKSEANLLLFQLPELRFLSCGDITTKSLSCLLGKFPQLQSLDFGYIRNSSVKKEFDNLHKQIEERKIQELSKQTLKNEKTDCEKEIPTILQKEVKSFHTACHLILNSRDLYTQNQATSFLKEMFLKAPGKEISQALEITLLDIPKIHDFGPNVYYFFGTSHTNEISAIDAYCRALNLISKLAEVYCTSNFNFENSSVLSKLIKKLVEECKVCYRKPSQLKVYDTSTIPNKIINILRMIVTLASTNEALISAIPAQEIKAVEELLLHLLKNQYDMYHRSLYRNAKRLLTIIHKHNSGKLN